VHIFGQTADMDPIAEIAEKHGLLVIEDACQAHGAEYKGRRTGSLGDAGCFSFYPGKNLGAYGEAGAVTTDRDDLAEKVRVLRDHGQVQKYVHSLIGWNARMDGLQGAILSAKLRHLAEANLARRANAIIYRELMSDLNEVALPEEADYAAHVYHIFAIRAPRRDSIIRLLAEFGVTAGIHYPIPIHLQAAYSHMGLKRGAFPVSESCSDSFISLPMFPELSPEQMEYVARGVARALEASDDRFARKAG
jgi:dTDP-4-amino-4,6-dideoxygalactose transaminase